MVAGGPFHDGGWQGAIAKRDEPRFAGRGVPPIPEQQRRSRLSRPPGTLAAARSSSVNHSYRFGYPEARFSNRPLAPRVARSLGFYIAILNTIFKEKVNSSVGVRRSASIRTIPPRVVGDLGVDSEAGCGLRRGTPMASVRITCRSLDRGTRFGQHLSSACATGMGTPEASPPAREGAAGRGLGAHRTDEPGREPRERPAVPLRGYHPSPGRGFFPNTGVLPTDGSICRFGRAGRKGSPLRHRRRVDGYRCISLRFGSIPGSATRSSTR